MRNSSGEREREREREREKKIADKTKSENVVTNGAEWNYRPQTTSKAFHVIQIHARTTESPQQRNVTNLEALLQTL